MQEIPIYFKSPDEEVTEIDPYEEFKIIEVESEDIPIVSNSDRVISIDTISSDLGIDDIVKRSGETLNKVADEIKHLNPNSISNITNKVNESISEAKDFYTDLDGKRYIKDQLLQFEELKGIIDAIQSIYGKICLNGFTDTEIRNPISDVTMRDLLNRGIFDFASCFLAEVTAEGGYGSMKNYILKEGINVISSDSMRSIDWIDDSFNSGVTSLYGDNFKNSVVSQYLKPPSVIDNLKEVDRIEKSMNKLTGNWFSGKEVSLSEENKYIVENIDTIRVASDSMRETLEYSDNYNESLIVTEAYEIETEFDNYLSF